MSTSTDDLPDEVTYVSDSADLGSTTGADPLIWTIPQLPTSTVATLLITVTILVLTFSVVTGDTHP